MEKVKPMSVAQLNAQLGNIDLYLLDQILKGRFEPDMRILDAGCGEGRNVYWFIQQGFDVFACDTRSDVLQLLRYQIRSLGKPELMEQVYEMDLAAMLFPDAAFDVVICSAVLHFAKNEAHWEKMINELHRVCKPGGMLFIRAATNIGLPEDSLAQISGGWYGLPDGSERFLLSTTHIEYLGQKWEWIEPIKTVLMPGMRSMLTLVGRKRMA